MIQEFLRRPLAGRVEGAIAKLKASWARPKLTPPMSELARRRILARRDVLMKRLEMMTAEDFAGESSDVALQAIADEMEHLIDVLRRLELQQIARDQGLER